MTNELINYNDTGVVDTIKSTIAKDATDHELKLFMEVCKLTKLNPFNKEIWFLKIQGRACIMTGNAGYWAIANSHDKFDGFDEGLDYDKDGKLLSAWCTIFRKDRGHATKGIALLAECRKNTPIWSERCSMMLLKCAENIALKKAFPNKLNALETYENLSTEYDINHIKNITGINAPAQIAEETKKEEIVIYNIPAVTKEQSLFLQKRGVEYDGDRDLWISKEDLGPKLAQYKVVKNEGEK